MPAKKTQSAPISLEEISGMTTAQTANAIGERYQTRRRTFVEMGKLIYHLESACKLKKGQTVYGLLKGKGVPESSVNNCRLVARFIETFVRPELVSETRMDEIITFRIANVTHRIVSGKTDGHMSAEQLAGLLAEGEKSAIGDELDCIAEHGMTIADKEEADRKAAEEAARVEAAQEAAANAAQPDETPAPAAEQTAESEAESTDQEAPATEEPPAEDPETPTPEAPKHGTPETPAPDNVTPIPDRNRGGGGTTVESVLKSIGEIEMASYELAPADLQKVVDKLDEWKGVLASTIEQAESDVALTA